MNANITSIMYLHLPWHGHKALIGGASPTLQIFVYFVYLVVSKSESLVAALPC